MQYEVYTHTYCKVYTQITKITDSNSENEYFYLQSLILFVSLRNKIARQSIKLTK